MTLDDWIQKNGGNAQMDGLTFILPDDRVGGFGGPKQKEMKLKSAYQMGATPGGTMLGLWLMTPEDYPEGRVFPLFNVDYKDLLTWEVVE